MVWFLMKVHFLKYTAQLSKVCASCILVSCCHEDVAADLQECHESCFTCLHLHGSDGGMSP